MIRTNNHTGIMEMHYAKERKKPKQPEPEVETRQWTMEEMLYCQNLGLPDRTNKYRTTAFQRPIEQPKQIIDIWEDK